MEHKDTHKTPASSVINIIAGMLFLVAAFHVITGEAGIDYLYIIIGLLLLAAGITGTIKRK